MKIVISISRSEGGGVEQKWSVRVPWARTHRVRGWEVLSGSIGIRRINHLPAQLQIVSENGRFSRRPSLFKGIVMISCRDNTEESLQIS